MVIVEHVRCGHGGLKHASHGDHEPEAEVVVAPETVEATNAEADHAHCDWCAHEDPAVAPLGAPMLVGLLDWSAHWAWLGPAIERRPVPLLALAPKQSPPKANPSA
jgi:hypothetical protein